MTTPVEKYKTIELYGGAFSLTVPERFVDISDYRPIPDHQEVYIDPDLDQSIIVELNSQVEIADSEAIVSHWNELMRDSNSTECQMIGSGQLTTATDIKNVDKYVNYIGWADGLLKVGKYKEEARNVVRTYIVNIRMPCVTTDVLIIFNLPVTIDPDSAAAAATDLEQLSHVTKDQTDALIQTVVSSFTIKSMSIFPEMQGKE